jgi:flagellin-like protein
MKIRNGNYAQKKAISPIIATVLIIAVTLIAAVAIGGFVFGIFGSASATANIQVTSVNAPAADFNVGTASATFSCATTATAGTSNIAVTNTGTAAASASSLTITWAGQSNTYTGSCTVGAAGSGTATEYITLPKTDTLLTTGVPGQTFTGTIAISNGASVLFTGTFQ